MEKRCFRCLCIKPIAEFYRHAAMGDGHLNKCKECTKADVARHRIANIQHVRAYDRLRGSAPHRVAARKEYANTPEGRLTHKRAVSVSRLRFPEKARARAVLNRATRAGRVTPWPVCAVPECDGTPEAHHPDYSAPLAVVWLCNPHHREAHAMTTELEDA